MCPLEPRSDSRSSPSPAPGACMAPEPLRGSSLDGTRRPRQATAFPHQSRPPVLRAPAEGPGLEGSTALRLLFQRLAVHMLRLFLLRSLLCVRAATVRGEPCGLRLSRTCSSQSPADAQTEALTTETDRAGPACAPPPGGRGAEPLGAL